MNLNKVFEEFPIFESVEVVLKRINEQPFEELFEYAIPQKGYLKV